MSRKRKLVFAWCVCVIFSGLSKSYAADTLSRTFPSAILVQLRSEQSRINGLIKVGDTKALAQIEQDGAAVATATINDFHDHLDYCPVYYYMDSNLSKVMNRQFDGVLTNADGKPVKSDAITDTDYFIVFYGSPTEQRRVKNLVTDSSVYQYNSGEPFGKGLIINNYKMQQVSYLYQLGYDNVFFNMFHRHSKYAYESRRYDIEYFPFAIKLNKDLNEGGKIRIRRYNQLYQNHEVLK
jgi:hypothetical protein